MMKYWLKYIDSDKIKAPYTYKYVGAMDALHGDLENLRLCVFAMK